LNLHNDVSILFYHNDLKFAYYQVTNAIQKALIDKLTSDLRNNIQIYPKQGNSK